MDLAPSERDALAAILIVEASQRPSWVRGIEWTTARVGKRVGAPVRVLPRTLGPLQILNAPRSFDEAIKAARRKLEGHVSTPDEIAVEWYGSRYRSQGSSATYSAALIEATGIWRRQCRTLGSP